VRFSPLSSQASGIPCAHASAFASRIPPSLVFVTWSDYLVRLDADGMMHAETGEIGDTGAAVEEAAGDERVHATRSAEARRTGVTQQMFASKFNAVKRAATSSTKAAVAEFSTYEPPVGARETGVVSLFFSPFNGPTAWSTQNISASPEAMSLTNLYVRAMDYHLNNPGDKLRQVNTLAHPTAGSALFAGWHPLSVSQCAHRLCLAQVLAGLGLSVDDAPQLQRTIGTSGQVSGSGHGATQLLPSAAGDQPDPGSVDHGRSGVAENTELDWQDSAGLERVTQREVMGVGRNLAAGCEANRKTKTAGSNRDIMRKLYTNVLQGTFFGGAGVAEWRQRDDFFCSPGSTKARLRSCTWSSLSADPAVILSRSVGLFSGRYCRDQHMRPGVRRPDYL
jgi:hypothetical protein